ncbi:hypothetical protein EIN_498350 [Entamoeba invadens IP1]|uniref:Sel1 repeat family protein n=1 Tax=Entamoeba invadens IP1 TaxID=370355 RepID=A0A0A1UG94_ENTIV|nr:hypothetical protein EIN_498350 [Entamoeba invadens IP1]ELP94635.1 hypothetical protein EIN_498350 [Entamoeba invadens IP1]|eukprot:XP_004261406.1 hypothetical protein EIN_498350 [Entamoeba invadens IP1]
MKEEISLALSSCKEILEFATGSPTVPETLEDSVFERFQKTPKTAREHLLAYLDHRIIRDIPDNVRDQALGDPQVSHFVADINLNIAVKMGDHLGQIISGNNNLNGFRTSKNCIKAVTDYVEGLKPSMWYDSEFETKFEVPSFQPMTFSYAHINMESKLSKTLNYLKQPIDDIVKYKTLLPHEMIEAGKLLYRMKYTGKGINDLFQAAYDNGDPNGLVLSGILKEYGIGVEKNKTAAAEMFFEEIEGTPVAVGRIGLLFNEKDSPIGYSQEEVATKLVEAANRGHGDSMYRLMLLFNDPQFVQYNKTRAMEYRMKMLLKRENHGHMMYETARLMFDPNNNITCMSAATFIQNCILSTNIEVLLLDELASRYYEEQMYRPALVLYQFLGELGIMSAQLNAAFMLEGGIGCSKVGEELRFKKALDLYKMVHIMERETMWKYVIDGIPGLPGTAAARIGNMYFDGKGLERDIDQAIEWYKIAYEDQQPEAIYKLGLIKTYYDKENKYKLKEASEYFIELMNIRGFSTIGYLMLINYYLDYASADTLMVALGLILVALCTMCWKKYQGF